MPAAQPGASVNVDAVVYEDAAERAAFRLLRKFHCETACGRGGMHWAECDALVDAFGWVSWEAWVALVTRLDL